MLVYVVIVLRRLCEGWGGRWIAILQTAIYFFVIIRSVFCYGSFVCLMCVERKNICAAADTAAVTLRIATLRYVVLCGPIFSIGCLEEALEESGRSSL